MIPIRNLFHFIVLFPIITAVIFQKKSPVPHAQKTGLKSKLGIAQSVIDSPSDIAVSTPFVVYDSIETLKSRLQ